MVYLAKKYAVILFLLAGVAYAVPAQQVVVSIDHQDIAVAGFVEAAVLDVLFDGGMIVWSDVPQGFLSGNKVSDQRVPVSMEYQDVQRARQAGADFLVQIRMPAAGSEFEAETRYSLISVAEPQILFSDKIDGKTLLRASDTRDEAAARLGMAIGQAVYSVITGDDKARSAGRGE